MSRTSSLPVGTWWNQLSAIAAYAVRWIAYHHSYGSRRRATTIELSTTTTKRAVPIVAVTMPGYTPPPIIVPTSLGSETPSMSA